MYAGKCQAKTLTTYLDTVLQPALSVINIHSHDFLYYSINSVTEPLEIALQLLRHKAKDHHKIHNMTVSRMFERNCEPFKELSIKKRYFDPPAHAIFQDSR